MLARKSSTVSAVEYCSSLLSPLFSPMTSWYAETSPARTAFPPPAPRPCSKICRVRTRVSCVCTTARSRPQWSKSESPAESESTRMTSTPAPRRRLANIGPIEQLRAGRLWRRLPQLFIGLYLFGAVMAMMVTSGLGMMPWDVLHSGILRHVPLTFGTIVTLLSFVVLLIWIPLRQQPGIGTILNALLIGPSLALTRLFLP